MLVDFLPDSIYIQYLSPTLLEELSLTSKPWNGVKHLHLGKTVDCSQRNSAFSLEQ